MALQRCWLLLPSTCEQHVRRGVERLETHLGFQGVRSRLMLVRSAVAQMPVTWDIRKNLAEIARAVEACADDPASHCPTMIVSPRGEVIGETLDGNLAVLRTTIDTAATSDWYLGQRRTDVVEVRYLSGT
jgi:hypothetical protein